MKNAPIDGLAAKDIQAQVDKVLRGLGNPEPPLSLADVRALQKLDLQYYSSVNDGPLRELVSKVRIGLKQLAMRPTLLIDVVRKAEIKGLYLPDRKRILIDEAVPDLKKRQTEAHEIIHSITPHHAMFLLGDNRQTLCPSYHEALEGEANYGASQLLFMRDRFTVLARDLPMVFKSVDKLHDVFGNTLTTTLWRFVEDAPPEDAVFGLVSCHPRHTPDDFDPAEPCRYFIESAGFRRQFGNVTSIQAFEAMRSYASWKKRGPLGDGEVVFKSRDGEAHRFRMETFGTPYDCLTLGTHLGPVRASIVVP